MAAAFPGHYEADGLTEEGNRESFIYHYLGDLTKHIGLPRDSWSRMGQLGLPAPGYHVAAQSLRPKGNPFEDTRAFTAGVHAVQYEAENPQVYEYLVKKRAAVDQAKFHRKYTEGQFRRADKAFHQAVEQHEIQKKQKMRHTRQRQLGKALTPYARPNASQ